MIVKEAEIIIDGIQYHPINSLDTVTIDGIDFIASSPRKNSTDLKPKTRSKTRISISDFLLDDNKAAQPNKIHSMDENHPDYIAIADLKDFSDV